MKRIGLHIRIINSLVDVAQQAIELQLPFFQSFIIRRNGKHCIWPTPYEEATFRALCNHRFTTLFAHGAFWINLSHTRYDNAYALGRELACVRRLGFTHLVVHAGSATGSTDRNAGIDALVRTINTVMRYEREIILVLENTAHGNLSVGSNIDDFAQVRQKLTHPEKVKFCIDTAHAYSYGYHIKTRSELDAFVSYIDKTLALDNIALIHLNDVENEQGSCMDKHAIIGSGMIGTSVLRQFMTHEKLQHIPIILEPPAAPLPHIIQSLNTIRQWHIST